MTGERLDVDLELHKLIEAHRKSLGESRYEIVSRVLRQALQGAPGGADTRLAMPRVNRPARRRGHYAFRLFGRDFHERSLKLVLRRIIREIEKEHPGFIEKLAIYRTPRGRRIVARRPEEIYPGRPDLATDFAEKLNGQWWYDTNISSATLKRYVARIAEIVGLEAGDIELLF